MADEFGPKMKQGLADLLGGKLVTYQTAIALTRGRDQLLVQFFGYREDHRLLGVRVCFSLDRAEKRGDGMDARPSLDGLAKRGDYFQLTVNEGLWGWPWVKKFQPTK